MIYFNHSRIHNLLPPLLYKIQSVWCIHPRTFVKNSWRNALKMKLNLEHDILKLSLIFTVSHLVIDITQRSCLHDIAPIDSSPVKRDNYWLIQRALIFRVYSPKHMWTIQNKNTWDTRSLFNIVLLSVAKLTSLSILLFCFDATRKSRRDKAWSFDWCLVISNELVRSIKSKYGQSNSEFHSNCIEFRSIGFILVIYTRNNYNSLHQSRKKWWHKQGSHA